MKILTLFGGKEFILEDDEAANIISLKKSGSKDFIELRCGAFIDSSAIQVIESPPLKAFIYGYLVNADGKSFIRNGERVWIEHFENIEYLPDPKYQKQLMQLKDPQIKKLK